MATHAQCGRWEALTEAVRLPDWDAARLLADELHAELAGILRQRSVRGPSGEIARAYHRDGLFSIGWQRLLHAPVETRHAVERYNKTLCQLPGPRSR